MWSGLSSALIDELARSGEIVSSNVIRKGNSRGRRVILVESLDAYILAGVGRPAAKLVMNEKRKGGAA